MLMCELISIPVSNGSAADARPHRATSYGCANIKITCQRRDPRERRNKHAKRWLSSLMFVLASNKNKLRSTEENPPQSFPDGSRSEKQQLNLFDTKRLVFPLVWPTWFRASYSTLTCLLRCHVCLQQPCSSNAPKENASIEVDLHKIHECFMMGYPNPHIS